MLKLITLLVMALGWSGQGLAAPLVYVPNEGNATISVIDPVAMQTIDTMPYHGKTRQRINGFVFDRNGTAIYVVDTIGNVLGAIRLGMGVADRRVTATEELEGISVSPDARHIAICTGHENAVVIIDAVTLNEAWRIPLAAMPDHCQYSPDGKWLLAGHQDSRIVEVLDIAARKPATQIRLAENSRGFGFTPDGKIVFIANQKGSQLEMVETGRWKVVRAISATARNGRTATDLPLYPHRE